ncbi:MAG: M56 family metallopeptidase [Pirellulaceae bacterium]|nr:M56 family metallopeptidase [Pirellulaceae bacterium]
MNGNLLIQLAFVQTLQITVLACIVLVLTRYMAKDRPHLAHALWALVLLKCLTPPVVASPTSVFSWLSNGYQAVAFWSQSPPKEIELAKTTEQAEGLAPVIVRMPADSQPMAPALPAAPLKVDPRSAKLELKTLIWAAILAWISIAACVLTLSILRLAIFLRRVTKATLPSSPSLNSLVESLSKRMGLRRKVRLRTVDAAIGPAVVGLIRPTILLPKVIVDGKSDAELEPLLAHELIHVRRGDLVWAMLQGLSVSLWWFNPLVWLAERLLTREAERSCDEETIAGLGCSPAMYARSLLDVMERKHQLRAAPSLPGVRPVDITAKRLERIMRLGQGCYRQRPWWVVAVWLVGCALVLPGAAWVVAQEQPKQAPGVFKEASSNAEANSRALRLPRAKILIEGADLVPPNTKPFEVGSLLTQLCEDQGLNRADAVNHFVQLISSGLSVGKFEESHASSTSISKQAATGGVVTSHLSAVYHKSPAPLAVNGEATGTEEASASTAPSFEIAGDQLHVRATEKELSQIAGTIEHFRKCGFTRLVTSVVFYEIPQPVEFDNDAFQAGEFVFKSGGEVASDLGVKGSLAAPNSGVFNDAEVAKLKRWLEQQKDAVCIASPLVSSLNGQRASVQIGEARNFIVAYKTVKADDGSIDSQPVNEAVQTGIACDIRAVVTRPANEGDEVTTEVSINCQRSNIKSVSKFTFSGAGRDLTTEQPVVDTTSFETGARLKLDQSLATVLWHENKTLVTIVHCKPVAANVGAVPPAVLGNGDKPAYVTVSDQLKSESEIALLKCVLAKLGIKDFRIDDGRMQVNVTEDWKAAANAFQELRDLRNTSAEPDSQTAAREREFVDKGTAYEPLIIYGPHIQQQIRKLNRGVPLLKEIPYVNRFFRNYEFTSETEQREPTNEDILRAVAKHSKEVSLLEAIDSNQVTVKTKQVIMKIEEPGQISKLVSDAITQHRHFKCSLHDANTDELKSVVYVDFCQFLLSEFVSN